MAIRKNTLAGQFLLAMPSIGDARFDHSLIYLHEHSPHGAMGFVINHIADDITLADILDSLDLPKTQSSTRQPVFIGGPVDTGRGFVLHDDSYRSKSTVFSADKKIGVTATLDVLEMLCARHGIENAFIILGYAGWGAGQIEQEIQDNAWLICPFNEDLLFSIAPEKKYQAAMAMIGIDPAMLSSEQGSA